MRRACYRVFLHPLTAQIIGIRVYILFIDRQPWWVRCSSLLRLHVRTQIQHNRQDPPDRWSVRRRELYLTTHNTHIRQVFKQHDCSRTRSPSERTAPDTRLGPRAHQDRHTYMYNYT